MDTLLSYIANTVRRWMLFPAKAITSISGGKVTPNHITLVSLLGHLGVVWALMSFRPLLAALLLAFFGILDSLDGALAKIQKKASTLGMFYDAVSDRAKEVLLSIGLGVYVFYIYEIQIAGSMNFIDAKIYDVIWRIDDFMPTVILVLLFSGLSQLISYTKAKGELALSEKSSLTPNELNRVFASGFARYEVRMALIIIGLLTGSLLTALTVACVASAVTLLQRLARITKALKNV